MKLRSFPLVGLFFHIGETPRTTAATPSRAPTHHVVVVDCSGSMSGELPLIVHELGNKLPDLLDPGDFFSLVWFSGRGECGTVLSHDSVKGLKDISRLQGVLKKWLKPVGMTGFLAPAQLAEKLFAEDGASVRKSLLFMSDGCENQHSKHEVLHAFTSLGKKADAVTVVEYGFYADRSLLSHLAEVAGGSVVLARDFLSYNVVFEKVLQSGGPKEKLARVELPHTHGPPPRVFTVDEERKAIRVFAPAPGDDKVFVYEIPEGTKFFFLSPTASMGALPDSIDASVEAQRGLYAAAAVHAHRMEGPIVRRVLSALGDVRLWDAFGACFGKQRYADFVDAATAVATGEEQMSASPGIVLETGPRPTLLDLLRMLEDGVEGGAATMVLLGHPRFAYSRMSRARVDVSPSGVRFTPTEDAVPISGLTFNEERPNISLLTERIGTVDLSGVIPDALKGKVPEAFPTKVWRNYNITHDGVIHFDELPVLIDERLFTRIVSNFGIDIAAERTFLTNTYRAAEPGPTSVATVLDLRRLALTNWEDVNAGVSAKDFFLREYALHKARSRQKVFRALLDIADPEARKRERAVGMESLYGSEAAAWLASVGLTDRGFSPPRSKQADSTDVYLTRSLVVRMKGMSGSLPSMKEVESQIEKGKVKLLGYEMEAAMKDAKGASPATLGSMFKASRTEARRLLMEQARDRCTLLMGQIWFSEFASLDEHSMTIQTLAGPVECSATMEEQEVKI